MWQLRFLRGSQLQLRRKGCRFIPALAAEAAVLRFSHRLCRRLSSNLSGGRKSWNLGQSILFVHTPSLQFFERPEELEIPRAPCKLPD